MKKMNAYRYITAILFSLLIIFAGAGVAVIHCYCVSCRVTHDCCDEEHHAAEPHADYSTHKECCNTTIYKIDILKGVEQMPVMAPCTLQLCKRLADFLNPPLAGTGLASINEYSPPPPEPRKYLALYAVFII